MGSRKLGSHRPKISFDGVESWLPWVATDDKVLTDVCSQNAAMHMVLIEPRRMRDRARDLIAEEDDLARALASTWSRDPDQKYPRLHSEIEAFLKIRKPNRSFR